MSRDSGPRGQRAHARLPRDIVAELEQVSHFGKAEQVLTLVEELVEAYEDEDYAAALGPGLRAKSMAPRSAAVRELLGLVYYRLGRFRDAARELGAYRRMSDRLDSEHVRADCERAVGRPEKAIDILHPVVVAGLDPEIIVERRLVVAGALNDLGRHDQAVRVLEPVSQPREVLPYHLRAWYALADSLERAGRRADARSWWDLIYAEDPDFFDVANRRLRRD